MKIPFNENQEVFQLVVETKEGKLVFMRYLKGMEFIQGSGTTEEKSQTSLIQFLHLVLTYNAN